MARVDCNLCKKYSFDLTTGTVNTYEGENGIQLPVLRLGTPTPCDSCPKQSPEHYKTIELTSQNRRAWDFYQRAKAAPMTSDLFNCPTTQRNFYLIANTVELAKSRISEKYRKKAEEENG